MENKTSPWVIKLLLGWNYNLVKKYENIICDNKHYILKYDHPNKAVFNDTKWNCDHFKIANEIIERQNGKEFCIEW